MATSETPSTEAAPYIGLAGKTVPSSSTAPDVVMRRLALAIAGCSGADDLVSAFNTLARRFEDASGDAARRAVINVLHRALLEHRWAPDAPMRAAWIRRCSPGSITELQQRRRQHATWLRDCRVELAQSVEARGAGWPEGLTAVTKRGAVRASDRQHKAVVIEEALALLKREPAIQVQDMAAILSVTDRAIETWIAAADAAIVRPGV